jgi:predicted Zn-dependent peptidase
MHKNFVIILLLLQGILMGTEIDTIKFKGKEVPLIFEYNDKLPIFNLQFVFTNSGYIKDNNLSGITNITAKILNEGTQSDGAVEFARKLESKAISIHSTNGFETFVIEVSSLNEQYIDALLLLNQLLKDPNLTNDSLEKVKTLLYSKLQQKENDFDYVAKKNLMKHFFKDTPLENGSSGTLESIEAITLHDVQKQLTELFNLDNLIIVAGGQIKKTDFLIDITKTLKIFDSFEDADAKKITINNTPKEDILYKDTEQAYIYFASPFNLEYNGRDNYKSKVASFILGGSGFGSRLMEEIRVKNGLAYSAYGYITTQKTHSYFTGYLQTKIENEEKAKELVVKTIEEFVKNGVSQEELDAAKNFLKGSEPLRVETFSQRLGRSFNLYYKGFKQDYPQKELELIDSLSVEDLNKFIKEHNEILNLTFSIVTQEKEK